ncbi:MAG: hypothetical protein WKF81_14460 [Thermomicrobiales bacterium]
MPLPRYERQREILSNAHQIETMNLVPCSDIERALAASTLSDGAADLVRGVLQLGRPAVFAGGGTGIEYGSLLKTAVNPLYLRRHVEEAAEHLRQQRVDVLIVPGMSGFPIGSMYAVVANLPALLLKKQHLTARPDVEYPAGSFVIPSYTGDGDVVMSADLVAVQDIVDRVLEPQVLAQREEAELHLTLRLAGGDDIIDKATMSEAVSDSGLLVGRTAMESFVARHRKATADPRRIGQRVDVVAWVTPLIKGYNRPQEHLQRLFGVTPFAGLNITGIQLDPPAIGIEELGLIAFP